MSETVKDNTPAASTLGRAVTAGALLLFWAGGHLPLPGLAGGDGGRGGEGQSGIADGLLARRDADPDVLVHRRTRPGADPGARPRSAGPPDPRGARARPCAGGRSSFERRRRSSGHPGLVDDPGVAFRAEVMAAMVGATAVLLWLADLVDRRGVGDGLLLLFAGQTLAAFARTGPCCSRGPMPGGSNRRRRGCGSARSPAPARSRAWLPAATASGAGSTRGRRCSLSARARSCPSPASRWNPRWCARRRLDRLALRASWPHDRRCPDGGAVRPVRADALRRRTSTPRRSRLRCLSSSGAGCSGLSRLTAPRSAAAFSCCSPPRDEPRGARPTAACLRMNKPRRPAAARQPRADLKLSRSTA